jgi:hypothetical protein
MNGSMRSLAFADGGNQLLSSGGDGHVYHGDLGNASTRQRTTAPWLASRSAPSFSVFQNWSGPRFNLHYPRCLAATSCPSDMQVERSCCTSSTITRVHCENRTMVTWRKPFLTFMFVLFLEHSMNRVSVCWSIPIITLYALMRLVSMLRYRLAISYMSFVVVVHKLLCCCLLYGGGLVVCLAAKV